MLVEEDLNLEERGRELKGFLKGIPRCGIKATEGLLTTMSKMEENLSGQRTGGQETRIKELEIWRMRED